MIRILMIRISSLKIKKKINIEKKIQVQDEVKEEEDVRENEEGISWIESYYKRFFEPHTQAEYSLLLFYFISFYFILFHILSVVYIPVTKLFPI